ncbi:MAG: peptide chain release factor 1 [Nitriliruptorales bacterium]|nr:peptide chain release factor 1 [Nitriliruptorales bacterium]
MFERLQELEDTYVDLERQLADPEVLSDSSRYTELAKRHGELGEIVATYRRYREVAGDLQAAREMARDGDGEDAEQMRQEAASLEGELRDLEQRLQLLLLPTDPNDPKDVIVEIRAAAGGDEAGLFAGELRDMYMSYAQSKGWTVELMSESKQGIGGVKESVFEVRGTGAYAHLKHESGVHRVQRVPATESSGRIHTSTASVAVLPAAEEVDVTIDPNDLRIDVFRSSGPGGQSVNTTDSAVRVTHEPTGIVVACQDEKSQHQNREKALRILRSRLLQAEQERAESERATERRGQIGTGDRSEKIRTYNFPQSRITDHRIGLTVHNVDQVLGGDLSEIIGALHDAEREQLLQEITGGDG